MCKEQHGQPSIESESNKPSAHLHLKRPGPGLTDITHPFLVCKHSHYFVTASHLAGLLASHGAFKVLACKFFPCILPSEAVCASPVVQCSSLVQ